MSRLIYSCYFLNDSLEVAEEPQTPRFRLVQRGVKRAEGLDIMLLMFNHFSLREPRLFSLQCSKQAKIYDTMMTNTLTIRVFVLNLRT